MKHQTLNIIAASFKILAWTVVVIGVFSSILLGIRAATLSASIYFLLGGFLVTAIITLLLLANSKIIHLFIDIEENLNKLVKLAKKTEKRLK